MDDKEMVRLCPECGEPMSEKDKHDICKNCRKEQRKMKRKEWWSKHGHFVAALGVGLGVVTVGAVLSKVGVSSVEDPEEEDATEDEGYPVGEKHWNIEKQQWEKDGVPCMFRVGWTDARDGEHYEEEYDDVDQGYDAYKYKKKQLFTRNVSWEHIPSDEKIELDEE